MKRNDASPARLTIASSRAAERRSRVRKFVNGFRPIGPTFARNPALLGRRTTPAGIYLLDGRRAAIKNEKEGMKYIRFPGRSGASRWRIDETEDPGDHLRRLLRGRRLLRMDVRGGPAAPGMVRRRHHALDLHDVHARRGDLPRGTGRARPQHPPVVRATDPRSRGTAPSMQPFRDLEGRLHRGSSNPGYNYNALPPPLPDTTTSRDHVDRDIDELLESLSEVEASAARDARAMEMEPGGIPDVPTIEATDREIAVRRSRLVQRQRLLGRFIIGPAAASAFVLGVSGMMLPGSGENGFAP